MKKNLSSEISFFEKYLRGADNAYCRIHPKAGERNRKCRVLKIFLESDNLLA